MSWPQEAFLYLRQIVTPSSRPATGGNLLYAKSDNALYLLDADGTEHAVVSSSLVQFLGSATSSADVTATIGVESQVTNLSFSAVSGAVYRISGWAQCKSNTASGFSTLNLRTDTVSTGVTGTLLALGVLDHRAANRVGALPVLGLFTAGSTGTLYAKLTLTGGGGTSTATGTSSLSILTVERIA